MTRKGVSLRGSIVSATISAFLSAAVYLSPCQANADMIDFETVPGFATLAEGLLINNQFEESLGIIFSLEGGGSPRLAKVGNPVTAFQGYGGIGDNPAPSQGIGQYFLTDDGALSGLTSPPLIVTYLTPTDAVSGVILDIDFDERFLIEAKDSSGNVLQTLTIVAGDSGTGDGIATSWSFRRQSADIASIRFSGTRLASGVFGLGFDNFDARNAPPVPEPETYALMLAGLGMVGFVARRRKALA